MFVGVRKCSRHCLLHSILAWKDEKHTLEVIASVVRSEPIILSHQHGGNELVFEGVDCHVETLAYVRGGEIRGGSQVQDDQVPHVLEHVEYIDRCRCFQR